MISNLCIGDKRIFRRRFAGSPAAVRALMRMPDGTVDEVAAISNDGEEFRAYASTLTQGGVHHLRWNAFATVDAATPFESSEEQFIVEPSAFDEPFKQAYGIVQHVKPWWKHTGYASIDPNTNFARQTLVSTPRAGDVLVLFVWNAQANQTSTIGSGSEGWTRANFNNQPSAVSDEIWWKRWGDDGQTDTTEWLVSNPSGILVVHTLVVRGALQTGNPIDAVNSSGKIALTPIFAPSATATDDGHLCIRSFLTARTPEALPAVTRHTEHSEGRARQIGWVYLDYTVRCVTVSTSERVADAGAVGTATIDPDGMSQSQYLCCGATVILKPKV